MNKKQLIIICLIYTVLLVFFVQILFINKEFTNYQNSILEKSKENLNNKLRSSDYTSTNEGIGAELNVTLHQSLINNSIVEFLNLDNSNTFSEPFPQYEGFNTSYINISIDNIYAPNYTYIVEDDPFEASTDLAAMYATSFTVNSSCYITNASFDLFKGSGTPAANVYLFNSTWVGSQSQPNTASAQIIGSISSPITGWNNVIFSKTLLNVSLTDNNTWFIGLWETTGVSILQWRYVQDSTNGDNSYAYRVGVSLVQNDYECRVGLSPLNQDSLPSDIGLKINGTLVSDTTQGSGTWSSTTAYTSQTNTLEFSLTSDWWDVSCNVTNVQINYTKTDLKASSSFNIPSSGQDVQWNISVAGGLNYFDSRIVNFNTINFTIPETWKDTTIKVFNDTTEKTDLVKRIISNGYREVQVLNAGNGTNWYLNANSTNLLSSIDSYIGGISTNIANYSNIVDFNATFFSLISNGEINLSIYNPLYIDNKLNYSCEITTFNPSIEINLGNWDIASNITQYGDFRVIVFWNNNTAAGFLEKQITALGETEITITQPSQFSIFDSNEMFNISLNFKDVGQNLGIQNAIIEYRISGGSWSSNNVTELVEGNYNITINCSDSVFDSYGNFNIDINGSKYFFNNQSITLNFTILGVSGSEINSPAQDQTYDSDEIVTIVLSYDDLVKGVPIDNADIQWKVGLSGTYSTTNVSYVSGNYQIELWLRYSDFDGYGPYSIYFTLNKTNYYNQTLQLDLSILGLTTSQIDSPSQDQTYDSDEIITIILSYDDLVKSIPIDNALIQWKVGLSGTYSSTNVSYVSGNYQIELWLRHSEFDGYGPFTIYLTLNKTNYYNQTSQLGLNVLGVTNSQIDSPSQDQTYDSDEILTVILSYDDLVKSVPVDNALIQWKVGLSGTYSSTNVSYVSGNYQIELWLRHSEFEGYGPFTIYFALNKTNYYNQTESLNVNILGVTDSQIDSPSQDQTYDSDEILTIILSYDDSVKGISIDSALIQWKIGLSGTYSSTNVSYVSGNYQIELWLRYSEFDGYGPFIIYFTLNKTNYYNQTLQLDLNILGLITSQIDSPSQDQTYDSDEILTVILSYDDLVKGIPLDNALIQWKVGIAGTYSSINVSYLSGNYQIELWLRYSEFDGYGPFTIYFALNKTNYYNQTLQLDLSILGLTTSQIDSPSQDQTFYSNETLIIVLSFDDYIKGIPIIDANIQWKVGLSGTYSSTNVSYVSGNYQIELWLRYSEFDGYGPFTIYFALNKTNYYNQTEMLNINLIGLTSINIINITQYNQTLSLSGSIYECQTGENLTIYANFLSDYPNKTITGATGILTFNGDIYMSLENMEGVYEWEIDTSSLAFGLYNFNITFYKTYYENSTSLYEFRLNNLIAKIKCVQKPDSIRQGDSFYLNLKLYYTLFDEYPINNANISLMIDFGTSISYMDAFTNSSGITSYKVVVPRNANRIVITAYYSGNGTYTSASLEITDIELIPVEKGTLPFELLLIIIIGGAIAIGLSGVFIIRKKSKKKSLKAKEQAPVEPKSEKVSKAKIVEHSKPEVVEDTEIVSPETPTPILKEEPKGKIPEESEPISKEEMNGKATKSLTPNSSEKKKAKKEKNVKKNKKAKKTKKAKKSNNENAK